MYAFICIFIDTYIGKVFQRLMLALDFVIPISSTSLPGGNLVDGLPPAASRYVPGKNQQKLYMDVKNNEKIDEI